MCNSLNPKAATIHGATISQRIVPSQLRSGHRSTLNAFYKPISLLPSHPITTARSLPSRQRGQALITASTIRTAEPADTRIGFVGLGIMGYAMAFNLLKAGYSLTVWNRSPDKCDDLAAGGAAVANTPADVVKNSDIIIAMLSDREACVEVALGDDGIAGAMTPGKGYVDVSTVDAATAIRVATAVRSNGGLYLEAPVSGSKGPAEQGQLVFLTGGDEELFTASAPLLDVMGKASFFLGEAGAGARMKLVVNMVMGSMMAALAEGLTLAESSGLDKKDVVDVLNLGAMACPMFALKGPAMVEGKYPTAFPLKHQQKDLKYALELAEEVGVKVPTAVAANGEFEAGLGQGLGDADFSAVLEAVMAAKR
jgi:glyoxylate/succinic semialdehyde reductase